MEGSAREGGDMVGRVRDRSQRHASRCMGWWPGGRKVASRRSHSAAAPPTQQQLRLCSAALCPYLVINVLCKALHHLVQLVRRPGRAHDIGSVAHALRPV